MTDSQNSAQQSASAPPPANSAGALLRQYREAKGLHISILAAALKVPSSKVVTRKPAGSDRVSSFKMKFDPRSAGSMAQGTL